MNMDLFLLMLVTAQIFLILHLFTGQQRLKGVIRTGLRKAEADNCETVRLPYNQIADLMGWKPEFDNDVRTSVYPFRSAKDFVAKPGQHPATMTPARRKKL